MLSNTLAGTTSTGTQTKVIPTVSASILVATAKRNIILASSAADVSSSSLESASLIILPSIRVATPAVFCRRLEIQSIGADEDKTAQERGSDGMVQPGILMTVRHKNGTWCRSAPSSVKCLGFVLSGNCGSLSRSVPRLAWQFTPHES